VTTAITNHTIQPIGTAIHMTQLLQNRCSGIMLIQVGREKHITGEDILYQNQFHTIMAIQLLWLPYLSMALMSITFIFGVRVLGTVIL
jgi:hypothetical protein